MKYYEKIVNESWQGKTLGSYLAYEMALSKRMIRRLKNYSDGMLVNGEHKTVRHILKKNDKISVKMDLEKAMTYLSEAENLSVVYEDNDYLVVDKRPYMTMYPRYLGELGSLANTVRHYLESKGERGAFFPISRLDKGTSGLVLLAKHSLAASKMRDVSFNKVYQALVRGQIEARRRLINYLTASPYSTMRDGAKYEVAPSGKLADLSLCRLFYDEVLDISGVAIKLKTGRRHQIRVQLSNLGHVLLGDERYGDESNYDRVLLHASELHFISPMTEKNISLFFPLHSYHNNDKIDQWVDLFERGRYHHENASDLSRID